tara:strand:- start:778 stop:912 length:135 start_codon:yes stop_codon:yes gene_type:complete
MMKNDFKDTVYDVSGRIMNWELHLTIDAFKILVLAVIVGAIYVW